MTKNNIYSRTFKTRVRKHIPQHLALDSALKRRNIGKKHRESFVSAIRVPKSKKIFVTNRNSANSLKTLRKHDISAILTLGAENRLDAAISKRVLAYKVCNTQDLSTVDNVIALRNVHLPQTRLFLKHWLSRGNVLVHCRRGVCRSPLIALDYLINIANVGVEEAASLLTNERNCAQPTATLLQSIFD